MIDDGRIEGAYPELVELVSDVQSRMAEATEALCVQKMIDLNIDPDVVRLQALEIQRLRGLLQERGLLPVSERLPDDATKITELQRVFKTKWLEAIRKTNSKWLEKEDMMFLSRYYKTALAQYLQENSVREDLGYWFGMIDCNVIGNMFDNPELLRGEDDEQTD